MERVDVLFVIPSDIKEVYQKVREYSIEPPAKARMMCAYLMRRNCSVALIDATVRHYSPETMAEEVTARNPILVVVPVYGFNPSSSTQTMPAARRYAQAIKNLDPTIPILMTGTHPAALPAKTLQEEPTDYVCDGEGPITVYELLQVLKAGGQSLQKVQSLWYWKDGAIAHNNPAPLLDLNAELAIDGWVHMDPRDYYAFDWHTNYDDYARRTPYANPFSEDGCPFNCSFCPIQAPFRSGESLKQIGEKIAPNSYRLIKPEHFVNEVTYLVERFGVRHFKVPDEMFTLHPAHVLGIAKLVKERHGDSLNFWVYARVDSCRTEFLEPMRAAGMRWIALGIESANNDVREGEDKDYTDERIYDVVDRVKAAGIHGALNFIYGIGGETQKTMQETYDMSVALNGPFTNYWPGMALPGSKLHRQATANGYPLPERAGGPGWIGYAYYAYDCEPYAGETNLTQAEILRFRDQSFLNFYTRPEYRAMMLATPDFGEKAMRNIDATIARGPLKRRLLEVGDKVAV